MPDTPIFGAGDVTLESGQTLHGAVIAYATHGTLNADEYHVVLGFTPFPVRLGGCEHFISAGQAINPGKHCGVVFNTTGNGLSLSPSDASSPSDGALHRRLCTRQPAATVSGADGGLGHRACRAGRPPARQATAAGG